MQNTASVGNGIQYSTMNIYENAIPIWGWCHRRIDNKFILMVKYVKHFFNLIYQDFV